MKKLAITAAAALGLGMGLGVIIAPTPDSCKEAIRLADKTLGLTGQAFDVTARTYGSSRGAPELESITAQIVDIAGPYIEAKKGCS